MLERVLEGVLTFGLAQAGVAILALGRPAATLALQLGERNEAPLVTLVDHARRTKVREKREAWVTWLTLAMVVITVIAAIIAATPVLKGWLSTLLS